MRLFHWSKGRQGTGYDVFTFLYSKRLRIDGYFIRYSIGAGIPPHRDSVQEGERHYRFNVVVWPAKEGGTLICEHSLFRLGPINLFRPDLALHSVTPVTKGVRYVLSIGWIKK